MDTAQKDANNDSVDGWKEYHVDLWFRVYVANMCACMRDNDSVGIPLPSDGRYVWTLTGNGSVARFERSGAQ